MASFEPIPRIVSEAQAPKPNTNTPQSSDQNTRDLTNFFMTFKIKLNNQITLEYIKVISFFQ
jgi:hypothetical protein